MDYKRTQAISNLKMKLGVFFRIIAGKILAFQKILVYEKTLSEARPELRNVANVDVGIAQSRDILRLVNKFSKFRAGEAEKRLEAGHLCFVARKNGDIVHYKWVLFNETYVPELERKIRLHSDCAYIYDAYTVPQYRGMGISSKASASIFDYLFQTGIRKIYYLINANNFPSQRDAEKIGLRRIGEIQLIRLFKSRKYKCEAQTSRHSIELKELFSLS